MADGWAFRLRLVVLHGRPERLSVPQHPIWAAAREVFSERPLPGVLVVDRYHGYNRLGCKLQYCYAHLLRDVEDVARQFHDSAEVAAFTCERIALFSSAMHLRSLPLSDEQYYEQAALIRGQITALCRQPVRHMAVHSIHDIFRDKAERLYHCASDRAVPADNNRRERDLQLTVISRKVSFGSQSEEGARTPEVMMTVVHTLKKSRASAEDHFKKVLDQLAADLSKDPFPLLFEPDTS